MTEPSLKKATHGPDPGDPALLTEHGITPMAAANALYSEGSDDIAEAIVASLSRQVFDEQFPAPASRLRRRLAGAVFQLLKRTTSVDPRTGHDGEEFVAYRNFILEKSGHPYALTLLEPSGAASASFVEGGDPMNAPYMMISPEISQNARGWDRILLDSVQGKDVQLRFMWETRATHEVAQRHLDRGEPVRLKAAAAGTGLSLILVYDRLIREGYDPELITATVTDRDALNVAKANRLMSKLASTRDHLRKDHKSRGISARVEDLLLVSPSAGLEDAVTVEADGPHHVVTLVGILEYFHGYTCATTEEHLGEESPEEASAHAADLVRRIGEMTADAGTLIANTYRLEIGARILEVFGKRMRYRTRENLHALADAGGFVPRSNAGSGNIYDVEVFEKRQ